MPLFLLRCTKQGGDMMNLKNNTIYKRILIYFTLFVFLPVTIITSILLININDQHERIALSTSTELAYRYQLSVEDYLQEKKEMLISLSSYNELTVFLSSPYQPRIDFETYNSSVISFFKGYAGNYYTDSIRLYITNDSIPEGHGTIYPIDYINQNVLIKSYLKSNDSTAIFPSSAFEGKITHDNFLETADSIIIIHKMMNYDQLLGIVILKLPETEIYSVTDSTKLIQDGSTTIINHSSKPTKTLPLSSLTGSSGVIDDLAYSRKQIKDFPYEIMIITDAEEPVGFIKSYQLIIFTILLLASSFMLYEIYKMTNRINDCLYQMNHSIQSNFSENLPITGNDEITKISQTINMLLHEIKHLIKRTVEQETIGKEAQIFALQNQINPHFIYNTMEIFSSQMEHYEHYDESDAMSDFAKMLRYNLAGKDYFASVKEEINHMNSYLNIQKIRYPNVLCHILIPDEVYSSKIIRFLFQPIIENSIQHGLERKSPNILLRLKAVIEDDYIHFNLSDNGKGMDTAQSSELNRNFTSPISSGQPRNSNIGLANINNRLRLFYGEECRLHVSSELTIGTEIQFKIPFEPYLE